MYLTDLDAGWVDVENPQLGLSFRLDFDAYALPLARLLAGVRRAPGRCPWPGSYALGIEPWTTRLPLEQAVAAGEAIALAPGERLSTTVRATFAQIPAPAV